MAGFERVAYDQEGLSAVIVEGQAVAIYAEGVFKLEMTLDELIEMAYAVMNAANGGSDGQV